MRRLTLEAEDCCRIVYGLKLGKERNEGDI